MVFRKFLLGIILFFFITTCSTIYLEDRKNDFADIPIATFEENVYGGGFHFWCFGYGVQYARNGEGHGIRNGRIGNYATGGSKAMESSIKPNLNYSGDAIPAGISLLLFNSIEHKVKDSEDQRAKKKRYVQSNFFGLIPMNCHAPVSLEFSLGLHYGIRAGFNLSEFFDFVLGWTTLDIMKDDFEEEIEKEVYKEGMEELERLERNGGNHNE
ncbi:MAG: hypothetical protein SFU98_11525 [Leptospiraceae bacterium]|nr:hypothetical protein [Leptospiraceae bacterium]